MESKRFLYLIFSLVISLLTSEVYAQSVTMQVSPGRGKREISVGDLFYITIEVKDIQEQPLKPLDVPGAKVVYFDRTGQWSSFTSVNGKTTQSVSYTYTVTLRAQKEGQFKYGPISVGGKKSNEVAYAIGAPMPSQTIPSQNQQNQIDSDKPTYIGKGDGNLFMRAEVSQSSVFVQQAIMYTVKLYSTYEAIKFIGATASPKFDGFVVEESKDISTSLEYETLDGKTYATAVIARYIIFPQKEGVLKVSGNTYTVSVDQREYYHDPWYGNLSVAKPLQLNVTPNDLSIKVNPLPHPVPPDFCGGVGNFKINSSLPSQTFKTNQAASIIYTIEGSGNLKYISMPDLQKIYPSELEVYTPSSDVNVKVGRNDVSGFIKYDYSFMPLESGVFKIPDVKLVFFNPEIGRYETSTASGYNIEVERGVGSEKSQTKSSASFDDKLMPVISDISFNHIPNVYKFTYWLWYIIPLGSLIISFLAYRSYLSKNSDIVAVKSRKANRMARRRLRKAQAFMKANDRSAFLDEIITSLWGYIGDKLSIPTSELSRDNIYGKLAMKEISDDKISDLIQLIDKVEYEKYAPSAEKSQMSEIYSETVNLMNVLEDQFKNNR